MRARAPDRRGRSRPINARRDLVLICRHRRVNLSRLQSSLRAPRAITRATRERASRAFLSCEVPRRDQTPPSVLRRSTSQPTTRGRLPHFRQALLRLHTRYLAIGLTHRPATCTTRSARAPVTGTCDNLSDTPGRRVDCGEHSDLLERHRHAGIEVLFVDIDGVAQPRHAEATETSHDGSPTALYCATHWPLDFSQFTKRKPPGASKGGVLGVSVGNARHLGRSWQTSALRRHTA